MYKVCPVCGKQYYCRPSQNKQHCSRECYKKNRKNQRQSNCAICGKPIYKFPYEIKKAKHGVTCGKECADKLKSKVYRQGPVFINVNCNYCGKTFETVRNRPSKYCSPECLSNSRKVDKTVICKNCGKPFEYTHNNHIFCSHECYSKNLMKRTKIKCPTCGIYFETTTGSTRRFCSHKCSVKGRTGKNSYMWKGGISFEPYCHKFNENFKERVRLFWDNACGICGKSELDNGKKLSVHHVNYEKMVCCNDVRPLFIPLCHSCHTKTNHNREYWENILTEYIMIWNNGNSYFGPKKREAIKGVLGVV